MTKSSSKTSEAAIFARVWETSNGGLAPTLARHIVHLGFTPEDQALVHELAVKNQEGQISEAEREVLDNYIKVGDLLAILQSKARKVLKKGKRVEEGVFPPDP